MIDLHTHLLPGVDDGARTLDAAVAALARLRADGVRTVACTPHLRASQVRRGAVPDHAARFAELRAASPDDGPVLVRGWEIMLDDPGVMLDARMLGIATSRVVLVELPRGAVPPNVELELARLRADGARPLVAHPERYVGFAPALARRWRDAGALLQGDATTLCGAGRRGELARALLAEGLYDVLASDNHGDARTLGAARDFLGVHGAGESATLLTTTNPDRLLRDEPVEPVPPVRLAERALVRLREWLLGRLRGAPTAPAAAVRSARD
jgi:protein-tyrosine phosphatase